MTRLNFISPLATGIRTIRRPRPRPLQMSPEEEASATQRLLSTGLSGLQRLGWFLDLPGATVRGLASGLSGGPWEGGFLNLPQGWDAFTDPYRNVTGRDLLERWGAVPENRYHGFESFAHPKDLAGDVAGFAAEVAMDPLAWMTFGGSAATRPAQLARKAGLLDDIAKIGTKKLGRKVGRREAALDVNLADVIASRPAGESRKSALRALVGAAGGTGKLRPLLDKPLGASLGLRWPPVFGRGRGSITLPGARGRARLRDALGGWVGGTQLGRMGKAGFQPEAMDTFSREAQEIAPEVYAGVTGSRQYAFGAEFRAMKEVEKLGVDPDASRQLLHYFVENEPELRALNTAAGQQFQQRLGGLAPDQLEGMRSLGAGLRGELQTMGQTMRDQGLRLPEALDERGMAYFARYLLGGRRPGVSRGRLLDPSHQSMLSRVEHLMDVPAAKMDIMAHDPRLVGAERLGLDDAADMIQREYLEHAPTPGLAGYVTNNPPADAASWRAMHEELGQFLGKKAEEVAELPAEELWPAAQRLVDRYRTRAKAVANTLANQDKPGAFWKHPLESYLGYLLHGGESVTASRGIFKLVGKHARPMMGETEEMVPLETLLTKTRHAEIADPSVASAKAWENVADALRTEGRETPEISNLLAWGVPKQIADDATRIMKGFTTPEFLREAAAGYDSFLNFWKGSVTSPWLAFHGRNRFSGIVNNALGGAFDPGTERAVHQLVTQGTPLKGAAQWPAITSELRRRGMPATDEAATELFQEFVYANELIGRKQMQVDLPMAGLEATEWAVPGARPMRHPLLGRLKTIFTNPLFGRKGSRMRGVAGAEETTVGLLKAGEELGWYVETMNRTSPFAALLKKGWDPFAAGPRVKQFQVDYANRAYTSTERAMLRLVPFGKFSRGMAKHVVKELSESPGGRLGQFIRASGEGREQEVLPSYVSQGMALGIPRGTPLLGTGPEGPARYFTAGGLMHEDPLSFIGQGGIPFLNQETGMEAFSRLTPALKWPLEAVTGQTFFQRGPLGGRPLEDLDPTVGRLLSNIAGADEPVNWLGRWATPKAEHLLAQTPATRFLTTARTLTDPRKRLEKTIPALADVPVVSKMPGPASLLNTLTGMRFMDVSEASRERALREMIEERRRAVPGSRRFEKIYIPKDVMESLPPDQQQKLQEAKALESLLRRRARARALAR